MAEDTERDTAVATATEDSNASDWGKMTPEERQADVDALVDAAKATAGPDEPDEEKQEDTEQTPGDDDETTVVADAAEGEDEESHDDSDSDVGEEGADGEPADWLDTETRDFANVMGVTDEDLKLITSRDELDRVLRIIDRRAFEAGKAALGTPPAAAVTAPAKEAPKEEETPPADDVLGELDKFKLGDGWEPEAAKPVNDFMEAAAAEIRKLRGEVGQMKAAREQESAATVRQQIEREATVAVRSLGMTKLFGEPNKAPTREQAANIAKAIEAHVVHMNGLFATNRWPEGVDPKPTPALMKSAAQLAFGDQLLQEQQRQRVEKLKKQSAKRTGGVAPKRHNRRKADMTKAEEIKADPEIDKMFNDLVAERNG